MRREASRVTKHSQIGISEIRDLFQEGHPAFQEPASPTQKSAHHPFVKRARLHLNITEYSLCYCFRITDDTQVTPGPRHSNV